MTDWSGGLAGIGRGLIVQTLIYSSQKRLLRACALIKCMANRTIFLKAYSNTDVKIFFSFVLEEVLHLIFFITIIYIYDILYISQN